MANSFVQAAKKVLQTEADALETLKNDLPNDFSDLVKLILNLNGRVIVSGVGKSGHIGNKIAATLASTGTPAYFVHATGSISLIDAKTNVEIFNHEISEKEGSDFNSIEKAGINALKNLANEFGDDICD